jgi:hypothetical protein
MTPQSPAATARTIFAWKLSPGARPEHPLGAVRVFVAGASGAIGEPLCGVGEAGTLCHGDDNERDAGQGPGGPGGL